MDNNTQRIYEKRVVAFVDILGWSEACKTESNNLTAAVQAIQNAANDFSLTTKNEFKRLPNIKINPMYLKVQVGAFSDTFAVSMPADYGYRIISSATDICRNLLKLGFLTRGAVTVGDLYHIDNMIFGPALIEAVRLEKEAVYPRLVCSPELIDYLKTFGPNECEHIVVDQLGRSIANLFPIFGVSTSGQSIRAPESEIKVIEEILKDEMQKHSKDRAEKKAEKWRYMRDVLPIMLGCSIR
jgi:hypothetical protein